MAGTRMRIVILGGGFAGAYCARELERAVDADAAEIVLIDRNNYFSFHPLLVEAGTGSLQPRHAVVPIREFVDRTRFLMAEVEHVDAAARAITVRGASDAEPRHLDYDHLVIALGSVTRRPPVPGLDVHGHQLKTIQDAVALRERMVWLLERADAEPDPERRRDLLRLVVVGANYTGVEVAGEYLAFLRASAKRFANVEPADCNVVLIELADRILPTLDPELADFALERLRGRGVDVRLGLSVDEVGPEGVRLSDGARIATHTPIWCAGIAPSPLLERLDLPRDERGWLRGRPDLRLDGLDDVWAIGDCAANPAPDGSVYPATAQHAVRMGKHLARNLARVLDGRETRPFDYTAQGALASFGCRMGVARVGPLKLSGFPAWFLWRTVYLLKMPTWKRRLRVALDWTLDLLFGRDVVHLGVARPPADERRPERKEARA